MHLLRGFCALLLALGWPVSGLAAAPSYRLDYRLGFEPDAGLAQLAITYIPGDGRLERLRFKLDADRHGGFSGDGEISVDKNRLTWRPPKQGNATLRFSYQIDRRRGRHEFDARITAETQKLEALRKHKKGLMQQLFPYPEEK